MWLRLITFKHNLKRVDGWASSRYRDCRRLAAVYYLLHCLAAPSYLSLGVESKGRWYAFHRTVTLCRGKGENGHNLQYATGSITLPQNSPMCLR